MHTRTLLSLHEPFALSRVGIKTSNLHLESVNHPNYTGLVGPDTKISQSARGNYIITFLVQIAPFVEAGQSVSEVRAAAFLGNLHGAG